MSIGDILKQQACLPLYLVLAASCASQTGCGDMSSRCRMLGDQLGLILAALTRAHCGTLCYQRAQGTKGVLLAFLIEIRTNHLLDH